MENFTNGKEIPPKRRLSASSHHVEWWQVSRALQNNPMESAVLSHLSPHCDRTPETIPKEKRFWLIVSEVSAYPVRCAWKSRVVSIVVARKRGEN